MKWSNITAKDLYKGVVDKLSLEPAKATKHRRAPESIYWYLVDGRQLLRVTIPNIHGGSGSLSTGFLTQIRQRLRLSTRDFEKLVECELKAKEFETIIREKLNI